MIKSPVFLTVYEDSDILVIEKKKAFLSQRADKGEHEALFEFVSRALGYSLYPVHRLDREVCGLMVYGKDPGAAEKLSNQFKKREITKKYLAWVYGTPKESQAELIHYLMKNEKTNFTTVFIRPTPGAKIAKLKYSRLATEGDRSLLDIQLETGRSHQIRAQLAKMGNPIIGDERYGHRLSERQRERYAGISIQLRSYALGLVQPTTGERLYWELPYDETNFFLTSKREKE